MPIAPIAIRAALERATKQGGSAAVLAAGKSAAVPNLGRDALKLTAKTAAKPGAADRAAVQAVGLTPHFRQWLDAHGYAKFNFARLDLPGGSFGGKANAADTPVHEPVIFIHGNTDAALGTEHPRHGGWDATIEYFLKQGYKPSELYAVSWGSADMNKALSQYHSKANLTEVRGFIEAVLEYTGAKKVNLVGHSMGVTLARKAIKGGVASDLAAGGSYNLGHALGDRVDTFIGIAGANQGLASSYLTGNLYPVSSMTNGFYPGYAPGYGQSSFLRELNANPAREGDHVYSIWSTVDEITGPGNLVWGQRTSRIPGQEGEKVFQSQPYGHIGLKDQTAAIQFDMVANHHVTGS